jgi:hypothetical protein
MTKVGITKTKVGITKTKVGITKNKEKQKRVNTSDNECI